MVSASLHRPRPALGLGLFVLLSALAVGAFPDRPAEGPMPARQDGCWSAPPMDLAPFACGEHGALTAP
jgi:hypothetical protein